MLLPRRPHHSQQMNTVTTSSFGIGRRSSNHASSDLGGRLRAAAASWRLEAAASAAPSSRDAPSARGSAAPDMLQGRRVAILLLDEDVALCGMVGAALANQGFEVVTTSSAAAALTVATTSTFDLLVVDLRLPDASGLDLVTRLRREGLDVPFIVVSEHLRIRDAINATRLGALDVLEKTLAPDELAALIASHASAIPPRSARPPAVPTARDPRGSSANRWAAYVVKICHAEHDPRTLEDWAHLVGISYSTLTESCRLVRLQPQAARDFARALRIFVRSRLEQCDAEVLLDVSDRRTLKIFLSRAGLAAGPPPATIDEFIERQRFITADNPAVKVLLRCFDPPHRAQ